MTTPTALHLFSPHWYEPINPCTQVDRLPGVDAPCLCKPPRDECAWPMCPWKKED